MAHTGVALEWHPSRVASSPKIEQTRRCAPTHESDRALAASLFTRTLPPPQRHSLRSRFLPLRPELSIAGTEGRQV
ncbi:hypothetical protein EJB05_21909, partial [Eragrostis curvula]